VSDGVQPAVAFERIVAAARDGRLDVICERFGVSVLTAFGSAIKASVRPPEDLDIGVMFRWGPPPAVTTPPDRIGLWAALADLTGCDAIDLVVLDVDDPVLRAEALGGIGLYERTKSLFAEARLAALGERRDTAHLRRRNLELMAR
jgi:predicted nucleotidyltransferase